MPVTRRLVVTSAVLLVLNVVLAVAYLVPAWSHPPIQVVGRVSIVNYIDSGGPWWIVGFGVTGVGGLAALTLRRWRLLAHSAAGVVAGMYAAALWFGALTSHPHTSLIPPILASTYCVLHMILADVYAEVDKR